VTNPKQGCQIFLGQYTKTGKNIPKREKNIPKREKIYQITTKCTNWQNTTQKSSNTLNVSIASFSKMYPHWYFLFANIPSGNPEAKQSITFKNELKKMDGTASDKLTRPAKKNARQ
jgi:hypothetical protein